MEDSLIVNVALTGCVHHKSDNPALPVTPQEVATDAKRCLDAGASVFHIHARDELGNPSWSTGRYVQYVEAVRKAAPGAVVVGSCSGRHFHYEGQRASSLWAKPDMASLTMGSVDFPDGTTSENGRAVVHALLYRMHILNVKPECEVFDLGHAFRLQELIKVGKLPRPYANIILGVHVPATRDMLMLLLERVGPLVLPSATAIGRDAWHIQEMSIALGCHVRVGLEDSLWFEKDVPATNVMLVERAVGRARGLGREPATPEQVREALGLGRVG